MNSFDSFSGNIIQKFTYGLQSPSVNFSRNKSALERIETIFNFNFKGELSPQLNYKIGGNLLYSWGKWKNNKFQTDENKSTFKIKDFYLKDNLEITVIGDAMLDKYIIGSSDRISPEAPVPVVKVNNEIYKPGGAANVAVNLSKLGCKVNLISLIGKDQNSKLLKQLLKKYKINFIFR